MTRCTAPCVDLKVEISDVCECTSDRAHEDGVVFRVGQAEG